MLAPKYKAYAGIGSRSTPEDICSQMTMIATQLSYHDFVLRSGGAQGADDAFELGADRAKREIYLPWPHFRAKEDFLKYPSEAAFELAKQFHPAWDKLNHSGRCLMARNSHQVLGCDLDHPSLFVLCWTPGGRGEGGTGQAIRIAKAYHIPVFDMGSMSLQEVEDALNELVA